MGRPHPVELRERVVGFVESGHSHRCAAERFQVSPRFVNDMVILKRTTGSLQAKPQGHQGGGKLQDHHSWLQERIATNGDLTLDELCVELKERGISVHRSSICRLFQRLGLSHKKKPDCQRTASH